MKLKTEKEIVRINGYLKEIITVKDRTGRLLHKIVNPLMVEFHLKDLMQVMVGASILAIPVGFTEETWRLGEILPFFNVFALILISLLFISSLVYYNYYRRHGVRNHKKNFLKRVLLTYFVSFLVVALLLLIIQKTPWATDWVLSFKRIAIVTFPASMSAVVADMIK